MTTNVKQMLDRQRRGAKDHTGSGARDDRERQHAGGRLRDAPEVEKSGKVAGAVHVSRGMLEFRADPESPYYDKNFAKNKTIILYCASGGRSALGGKVLIDMGYGQVYNVGAFKDWAESGGATEKPGDTGM